MRSGHNAESTHDGLSAIASANGGGLALNMLNQGVLLLGEDGGGWYLICVYTKPRHFSFSTLPSTNSFANRPVIESSRATAGRGLLRGFSAFLIFLSALGAIPQGLADPFIPTNEETRRLLSRSRIGKCKRSRLTRVFCSKPPSLQATATPPDALPNGSKGAVWRM